MRLETCGIAATPPDIRRLFDQQRQPEGCWDWFAILADTTLAPGEQAVIFALLDARDQPVAAIPAVTVKGRAVRGLTSVFTTDFAIPLGGDTNARILGENLARHVGGKLRLDALDYTVPAAQAFEDGLAAGGLMVSRFKHFVNWFEPIEDFSGYWDGRESRLKATVKRKAGPLLRAGRLQFEQIDLTSDWRRGAELYKSIYAKSWKPAEPHPAFIDALLERLGPRGIAKLGVMMIDGAPAAAQIWLLQNRCATIFKLAHDPAFDRQSPGTLLTHWFLHRLQEAEGSLDVDFGRGDDSYKRLWLASSRDRQGLLAANPRSVEGLISIVRDILPSRLAKTLRGKPGKGDAPVASSGPGIEESVS